MSDIHYFDASGKEVPEGSEASVVQHTEAVATQLGLKFKASDPTPDGRVSLDESMRLASLDGSETDVKPVTSEAFTEPKTAKAKG